MTIKETTEIFSLMLLAWPNAENFKGGIQKLEPTIKLWAKCLPDVDFWVAKRAVIKLCRECKFPPTIAEFKSKADEIKAKIENKIYSDFSEIRTESLFCDSLEELYQKLPERLKLVVNDMGGAKKLVIIDRLQDKERWNFEAFYNSYIAQMRKVPIPVTKSFESHVNQLSI